MSQTISPPLVKREARPSRLGATVYPSGLPQGLLGQLPELYGSLATTEQYFRIYDRALPTGACVLDDPRHVLVYRVQGDTVEIMNRVFEIAPEDAARACKALFEALPRVHRIHLEILFPPGDLRLPIRVLSSSEHRVIELPGSWDEYLASLGKHTRANLRSYERRLRRDFPDTATEVMAPGEESRRLFECFCRWKKARLAESGRASYWDGPPERICDFVDLLAEIGEAQVTRIEGRPAGMILFFQLGSVIDSNEGAFDPRFEPYALGSLMHLWMAHEALERGARRVYLGTGPNSYLQRFGSTTRRAARVSVFRDRQARLRHPSEAVDVGLRRARRDLHAWYWGVRHGAGDAARRLRLRSEASGR